MALQYLPFIKHFTSIHNHFYCILTVLLNACFTHSFDSTLIRFCPLIIKTTSFETISPNVTHWSARAIFVITKCILLLLSHVDECNMEIISEFLIFCNLFYYKNKI